MRRRSTADILEAGEGFIDVLFLLLTFFIIQNVSQIYLAEMHSRFVHAQKLDFVKALDEGKKAPNPKDERFLKVIIGKEFIQFEKGGVVPEDRYVFKRTQDMAAANVEQLVFQSTQKALENILLERGESPEKILVRLYFEREATVTYTVGVYDALTRTGFKNYQWGLESRNARL